MLLLPSFTSPSRLGTSTWARSAWRVPTRQCARAMLTNPGQRNTTSTGTKRSSRARRRRHRTARCPQEKSHEKDAHHALDRLADGRLRGRAGKAACGGAEERRREGGQGKGCRVARQGSGQGRGQLQEKPRRGPLPRPLAKQDKERIMEHEALNLSIRKFLKMIGVTSQREIERAVQTALQQTRLSGSEALAAKMTLEIPALGLKVPFDGELRLR